MKTILIFAFMLPGFVQNLIAQSDSNNLDLGSFHLQLEDESEFETLSIADETAYWRINATYPKFVEDKYSGLNEVIETLAKTSCEDFERSARMIAFSMYKPDYVGNIMTAQLPKKKYYDMRKVWSLEMGYEVIRNSSNFITMWLFEQKDKGEDFPKMKFHTINFRTDFEQQLGFREVFKTTKPLATIKPLIEKVITDNPNGKGTLPSKTNWDKYSVYLHRKSFDEFVIGEKGITFYFEPGVLNPRDEKYCMVLVEYEAIDQLLREDVLEFVRKEFNQ